MIASRAVGDAKGLWEAAKASVVDDDTLELGPYYTTQVRNQTRHLLFVLARYKFAARLLPQDRKLSVLELGCNEGVGSLMLAENGHQLTAVDFDEQAISWAHDKLQFPNVTWKCDDFLEKRYGTFDAAVSIDVIEHIDPSLEQQFMTTVTANLSEYGFAVIGTPNQTASQYASPASQIGHVNLYGHERLAALMDKHFHQSFLFGMNDEVAHTGFYPMCHYLMALGVCPRRQTEG